MTTDHPDLMAMLTDGVPVTLLLDLLCPPDAAEMYLNEGGAADWLQQLHVGAA
ncbi:MAG TPA: hypothetical protein VFT62_03015 [Mycobacteriales bacterium]|nr:hypothetical protein [Mycobacteriales bacterium]